MQTTAYTLALFALGAVAQTALLVLLLLSGRVNTTKYILIGASASTSVAAIAAGLSRANIFGPAGAIMDLGMVGSWYILVTYLLYKQETERRYSFHFIWIGGVIAVVVDLCIVFFGFYSERHGVFSLTDMGAIYSRLGLGVIGLLATENFYRNTVAELRWHINLLCVALAGIFGFTIVIYADALLFRHVSDLLWAGRGVVLAVAAPLLAVAAARNRDWDIDIHVSRVAVFHTATLIGSGVFLLALAATGELFRAIGPGWGELAEMILVIGGAAVIGVMITSGSARSRLRRLLAENFFSHRYDYRREWLRSIEILAAGSTPDSVQTRVIKAVAEVADSPGGILWVRDVDGAAFQWSGSWNQPAMSLAEAADSAFVGLFRDGDWVIELNGLDIEKPDWLKQVQRAWLAVPLAQRGELLGFVVLLEPRAPLKLNDETFDLLRIVAQQSAIHIAEQRSVKALAESRELQNFGKRFAFVAHDLKNVTSQLGMILQNARHYGDDPEFQQDVLATIQAALERINKIFTALKTHQAPAVEGRIVPAELVKEVVSSISRLRQHRIELQSDGQAGFIAMDAEAFRSVVTHLCTNAVEASEERVIVRIQHDAMRVEIEVADDGDGMSAEFIRDKLFQPFGSTKGDGMGIGAYQARELVRAVGGDLLVSSRAGAGTTMRMLLPCVALGSEASVAQPA